MKLNKALALAVASALMAATGAAEASQYTVTLQDANNALVYSPTSDLAGFYTLVVTDNSSSLSQTIQAMCDDFMTTISIGSTWQANVFTRSEVDTNATHEGDYVKFGPSNSAKYNEAGYLFNQALSATQADQRDIDAAIWYIMDNGSGPTLNANSVAYFNDAIANGSTFDYNTVMRVLTSHTPDVSQEFLVAVPAPGSIWLFGSVLGLLGGVKRKSQPA